VPIFFPVPAAFIHSSMWSQPAATRLVWVTMLAMCDDDGIVDSSLSALVAAVGLPKSSVIDALATLAAPDVWDNGGTDGRCVEAVERGWRIIGYSVQPSVRAAIPSAVRAEVLARDGMTCWLCTHAIADGDLHLDHVIPWSRGGPDTPSNLRPAHARCNIQRGNRPVGEL